MRKKWRGYAELVTAILLSIASINAQSQPEPVTLKKAVQMAIANNYNLKADSMNLLTVRYQKNVIKADKLPQVSYSGKSEYNPAIAKQMLPGKYVGEPDKEYVPVQFGSQYSMSHGVEVTQNLFRKDTKLQLKSADLNTRIAQTKHNMTREELIYQVATTFYDLQTNTEKIRTTTKDYNNIVRIVNITKAQVENGTVKRIDYESLQINAANKQSQLNELQSAYDTQLAYFKYLLGISPDSSIAIEYRIESISTNMANADNKIYNREDIHLNRQLIESKELELKTIRAEKLPMTAAYFRLGYQSQYNSSNDAFNSDYWYKTSTVGISTKISLFDGFRRKNRISIAQAQLQQLKFQGEQTQQYATTEWITANDKLSKDMKQYKITEQNLALAEKVFTSRTALYAEGVSSLIELLDADRELSEARNNYIQAMINVENGVLNTHKANGTILTEFLKTL